MKVYKIYIDGLIWRQTKYHIQAEDLVRSASRKFFDAEIELREEEE